MSISNEIERLQKAKNDIGDAIVRKGGSVSGTIDTYAKSVMALGDVSFRTAIDIVNKSDAKSVDLTMISPKNETSLDDLFRGNTNLTNINVSNWDTSNITSLRGTFSSMPNLKSVDFAEWNVSKVTTFYALFDDCRKVNTIDVSKWDTSSATNMEWMFCRINVTHLDVSNFDTSNVLNINTMFAYFDVCEELNINGLKLARCTSMNNTFSYSNFKVIRCDGLKFPDIDMSKIGLNYSKELTVDSIIGLLNALPQSDKGYSFQIGADNIAKLTDEQKAIATDKGWTLI